MFFCSLHEMTRLKQKKNPKKYRMKNITSVEKKQIVERKKMGKKCTKDEIG